MKKAFQWLGLIPGFAVATYAITRGQDNKWVMMGVAAALFLIWLIWFIKHIND